MSSLKKMNITTELEKLTSLKDLGDLTLAEFEKAKERLLFGDVNCASKVDESNSLPLPKKAEANGSNHYFLIAFLSTIAVAFSGGSAFLSPSSLKLIAFAGFTIAATLNWVAFLKTWASK